MLAKVISLLRGDAADSEGSVAPPLPPTDPREPLRAAFGRRDEAERRINDAVAATERVRQVIAEAAQAGVEAAAAEKLCVEATAATYATGNTDISAHAHLFTAAEAARSKAHRLGLAAKGAEAALHAGEWDDSNQAFRDAHITPAEAEARDTLKQAATAIAAAASTVMDAQIEPTLRRAQELHAELIALLPELAGARRLFQQNARVKVSYQLVREIDAVFTLPTYSDRELLQLMGPLLNFGNRLLADPEAQL